MLPLKLQPSTVLRLAAVRAASLLLLLLVAAETGAQLDVNAGRSSETEALRNLDEVKLVHVEHSAEGVRSVCLEIRTVTILGRLQKCISTEKTLDHQKTVIAYLVKIVVLADEFLQLGLHIDNLGTGELELHDWHTRLLEVLQETNLRRLEEHQTAALAFLTTSGTSDTVNVVTRIIRGIELDNPIDSGNLEMD